MGKPKVKKGKSGSRNDSVQQAERLKYHRKGDGGFISEKTSTVMKKKKK